MSIADEIKESFKQGGTLTKLIYVNLGVFVLINLVRVITLLAGFGGYSDVVVRFLSVPATVGNLFLQPWSVITYMFLHEGFFHILFNLLWLYWFGSIFLQYFTEKQLLGVYLLGGIFGAAFFILIYNISPAFTQQLPVSILLGASASVMAIAIGISVYVPDYTVPLIFIGPVKLKYLAVFFIVTDILQIASANAGGHIAHLGGALFGYIFALQFRKGKDRTKGINNLIDRLVTGFKPRSRMRVNYRRSKTEATRGMSDEDYNKTKHSEQEEVDRILDKIARSGYDSLSKREKEILFKMGKH